MIAVTLPIRLVSEMNVREHWAKAAGRKKLHRVTACAELRYADKEPRLLGPVVVTLTRIAPRQLDDDNLRGAFKAVRDGVADYLEVDDRDPRIEWRYAQEKGAPKQYAARVEIRQKEGA